MIAWDKVCKLRAKGGLGLCRMEAVNKAFRCKVAWRILENEPNLWVQAMQAKYLNKSTFLQYNSMLWLSNIEKYSVNY